MKCHNFKPVSLSNMTPFIVFRMVTTIIMKFSQNFKIGLTFTSIWNLCRFWHQFFERYVSNKLQPKISPLKSFAPFTSAQWFSFLLNLFYSLKWYKDDIEFYTYIPRMRDGMKQRFFDVPGVQIDVSKFFFEL